MMHNLCRLTLVSCFSLARSFIALSFVEGSCRGKGRHCAHSILEVMLTADVYLFKFLHWTEKVFAEQRGSPGLLTDLGGKDQDQRGTGRRGCLE